MDINNIEKIQALIAEQEGGNVEFKSTTGQLDRGMETLCAFLNGTGGTVLFGVTDDGTIKGQDVSDSTKRAIADAIKRIEPVAAVQISYIKIPNSEKSVIAIHVEEARFERPFSYNGRTYMRVESVTTTMPQSRFADLLMQREDDKHSWESVIDERLQLSDLDEEEILRTIRLGVSYGRIPETTETDIPRLLEKLGLMEDGKLKKAAAVLFANKHLFDYPQCLLRLARFKGTDKSVFIDSQRIYGNIFKQIEAAMAFFFKHLSLSGTTETLVREEHLTVPQKALREGTINALCHRSFRDLSSSVAIAIYDDRIEIENPGGLPRTWDREKLIGAHDSKPQNRLIADTLYIRKVLENWGRGVSLIMEECAKVQLPEPEYEIESDGIKLIFRYGEGNNIGIRQTPDKHPTSTRQVPDKYPTSTRQLVAIIGGDLYSVKEMMGLLQLKNRENFLENYLRPAMEQGFVEALYPDQPKHPKQKYRLTEKGKELLKEK